MDFLYPKCDVNVNINSTIDMVNSDQINSDKIPLFSAKV
jgi:hypothetical protein